VSCLFLRMQLRRQRISTAAHAYPGAAASQERGKTRGAEPPPVEAQPGPCPCAAPCTVCRGVAVLDRPHKPLADRYKSAPSACAPGSARSTAAAPPRTSPPSAPGASSARTPAAASRSSPPAGPLGRSARRARGSAALAQRRGLSPAKLCGHQRRRAGAARRPRASAARRGRPPSALPAPPGPRRPRLWRTAAAPARARTSGGRPGRSARGKAEPPRRGRAAGRVAEPGHLMKRRGGVRLGGERRSQPGAPGGRAARHQRRQRRRVPQRGAGDPRRQGARHRCRARRLAHLRRGPCS